LEPKIYLWSTRWRGRLWWSTWPRVGRDAFKVPLARNTIVSTLLDLVEEQG